MENLFEILYAINQNPKASQRYIATECGISVGKTNTLIKLAEKKGFITIDRELAKHKYQLTDLGLEVIGDYLTEKNNLKIRIQAQNRDPLTTAVILAAGKGWDFDNHAAFFEVEEGTTLIERTLRILFENGIEKVVIVTGYQHERFDELASKNPKIITVRNDAYQHTGTMKSLSYVDGLVDGDFLLLESDTIFEAKTIKQIIDHHEQDCMIITNESGSGDERFVEIRNNYIYNMTKDRHQLNKIDGEMIGLTKVSQEVFKKMIGRFSNNENPFLNYEYMLMDIGRKYNIGFEKIANLLWWEFDTQDHYDQFKREISLRLQRKEYEWHIDSFKQTIADALEIIPTEITDVGFVGGVNNTSYKITIDGKNYVARTPGQGTEYFINRFTEKANSEMAHRLGLDSKPIYNNPETGIKVAEFINGAEQLTRAMTRRPEIMKEVVKLLKRLHNSGVMFENDFNVFSEIERLEAIGIAENAFFFPDYQETKARVMRLEQVLEKLGRVSVPCHNDTQCYNMLRDQHDQYYLIDWEYGGNNDPLWDLSSHLLESEFTKEEELLLLQTYFETKDVRMSDKVKLLLFQICHDLFWVLWTAIKEIKGDNKMYTVEGYATETYERCKRKLDEIERMI